MLFDIILATTAVSLISLVGVFFVFRGEKPRMNLKNMISFAAGSLLAVSFLDLLPEIITNKYFQPDEIFLFVLASIIIFFILERVLHWHHCHCHGEHAITQAHKHTLKVNNLVGDGFHNLIDGFLIAGAFMVDRNLGLTVTLGVMLHEIPQEIADFGVLMYSGMTKSKALLYNLLIGLTSVLGAILFYYFLNDYEWLAPVMAAIAAGNFIYLATADILPELTRGDDTDKFWQQILWFLAGVLTIWVILNSGAHSHVHEDGHDHGHDEADHAIEEQMEQEDDHHSDEIDFFDNVVPLPYDDHAEEHVDEHGHTY